MSKLLLILVSIIVLFLCIPSKGSENSLSIVDQIEDQNDVTVEEFIDNEDNERSSEPFIPSEEWQTIRKGQVIPAGLHIRVNLETGLKEAKILDQNKEETDKNVNFIDRHKKVVEYKTHEESKVQSIKQLIKNMKFNEKIVEMSDGLNVSETKFRSISDIKKEFNEIHFKMQSESEVLKSLLQKYNKSLVDQKLILLSDIEYLVHSIDIAKDLIEFYGMDSLLPDFNSTDSRLRAQIALTIGSAMNSNPSVQIEAFKKGALKQLLLLLSSDSSFEVRKRCIFAISSLVRHFPVSQKSLIKEYGGLSIFAQIFKESDFNSIKLSAKIMTLLNDLFIERQLTSEFAANDELTQIKLKQYQEFDFNQEIIGHQFCQLIPNLLNSEDNQMIEKTIEAMNTFSDICRQDFQKSLSLLRKVCEKFKILSKTETNENSDYFYFTNLFKLMSNLIEKLNSDLRNEF